jgi:polyhydroxybutyrate depolymerase
MSRLPLFNSAVIALTALLFALPIPAVHAQGSSGGGVTETRFIRVNGIERSYLIHLPSGYNAQSDWPLVIALHGGGGSPAQFARDTAFSDEADKESFIVVYPHGTGTLEVWNAIHCCGSAFDKNVDDVGFISALIDDLIQTQQVDPKRVYATGHSNGGMLAYRLGAELSEKIAAISVSAGTIGGRADLRSPEVRIQEPAEPLSVLVFHGKLDQNVRHDGGITVKGVIKGRYDLSVAQSVGFWVAADRCTGQPQISRAGNITISDYTACEQQTEVTLYTIANQGHAWPGGSNGLIDIPTKEISATQLSWAFFKAHPKTYSACRAG